MNNNSLKDKIIDGFAWKFAEKVGVQLVQFVIQIILARLLLPEEYGIVGLLAIFITISDVFIQQGFTTALIQKKEIDDTDCSSVYFVNILMSIIIYFFLFFIAPYVSLFYKNNQLTIFLRILSINVIIGAFAAVHNALLSRQMDFKKSFIRNAFNVVTQGVVGIIMALAGMGVWSLVISRVAGTLVGTIALCVSVKWRPDFIFSIRKIKKLFSYSSKVLVTNLLNTIFNNVQSLTIGKFYSSNILGYYQRGQQIPQAFMIAFDGSFSDVLYPALSSVQSNVDYLKATLRRSIKMSMFIVLPALFGLIATSETLTLILLTDKWLPSVKYMKLQCVICMFWPLSACTHALNAMGKSDITLKMSIVGKTLMLIVIVCFIKQGIQAIMYGTICVSLVNFLLISFAMNRLIDYSLFDVLKDILPTLFCAGLMYAIVECVNILDINLYVKLILQIVVGVLVYISTVLVFKIDTIKFIMNYKKEV